MACLLWEDQFYEDGVEIAGRIAELVPKVEAGRVAEIAIEAREEMEELRACAAAAGARDGSPFDSPRSGG